MTGRRDVIRFQRYGRYGFSIKVRNVRIDYWRPLSTPVAAWSPLREPVRWWGRFTVSRWTR